MAKVWFGGINGNKYFICPDELFYLIEECYMLGVEKAEERVDFCVDYGRSMVLSSRNIEKLNLENLEISCGSEDFEDFYKDVVTATKLTGIGNITYYKVEGFVVNLYLSAADRVLLLEQMTLKMFDAIERAEENRINRNLALQSLADKGVSIKYEADKEKKKVWN